MPRKVETEKIESADGGHTVDRCQRALAAAAAGNKVYAAYWAQQLEYAERRAEREAAQRKEVFG